MPELVVVEFGGPIVVQLQNPLPVLVAARDAGRESKAVLSSV